MAASAFAGIVRFEGAPFDSRAEDRVRRSVALQQADRVPIMRADGALFAQAQAAPDNGSVPPAAAGNRRSLFVADARLDNREELADALQIPLSELARTPDSTLLMGMSEHWGSAGVARCLGAFAFAQWNSDSRCLLLGRDCLGNRPLFFHRGRGFAAFATSLRGLLALPDVPRDIDERVVANFLALDLHEGRRTFYRGVERVPSRTVVTIDRAKIEHRHYWSPDLDAPPPYRREQDYVARARELFDLAVASATRDTPHVAISTSGGLDSSAIAATVARLGQASRVTCYTLIPAAGAQIDFGPFQYQDERQKIEALGRMYPALEIRLLAPDGFHRLDEDDTRYFVRSSVPALNPSSLGHFNFLYDAAAAAGHLRLLTGRLGNFGLTWPGLFSLLALLGGRQWSEFAHESRALARETDLSLGRILTSEVLMKSASDKVKFLIQCLRGRDSNAVGRFSALNPAFIAEHGVAVPWHIPRCGLHVTTAGSRATRLRSYAMFDGNQFGRDVQGASPEVSGFEIADPHSDRRLLEFLLTVPEPMFRRNGIARSFARSVLADRLPPEILNERRRGAQNANWFRRLDAKRQAFAADIDRLEGSAMARRLIDLPRLKRLVEQWPADEHAAQKRRHDFRLALPRAIHIGNFIRWVEGGNA